MFRFLGDWRAQSRRLILLSGAIASLQLFSIAGPLGEALAEIIQRITIGYLTFMKYIWASISDLIGIQLIPYHHALTFIALVGFPYLIRWRRLEFSPFIQDENRILSFLNLAAVGIISTNIYSGYDQHTGEAWLIWLSALPFIMIFFAYGLYTYKIEPEYRPVLKIATICVTLCLILMALGSILYNAGKIASIFQPITLVIITIVENSVYAIGIMFRIDGYYPFLVVSLFFAIIWMINFVLVNWIPAVLAGLKAIGV